MKKEKTSFKAMEDDLKGSKEWKKMRVTNIKFGLAVVLGDVINTLMMDVDEALRGFQAELKHEDRRNFTMLKDAVTRCKTQAAKVADVIYQDELVESAVQNSDFLLELVLTVTEHIGTDNRLMELMLNKIKKSYTRKFVGLTND